MSQSWVRLFAYSPIRLFAYSPIRLFAYSPIRLFAYSLVSLIIVSNASAQSLQQLYRQQQSSQQCCKASPPPKPRVKIAKVKPYKAPVRVAAKPAVKVPQKAITPPVVATSPQPTSFTAANPPPILPPVVPVIISPPPNMASNLGTGAILPLVGITSTPVTPAQPQPPTQPAPAIIAQVPAPPTQPIRPAQPSVVATIPFSYEKSYAECEARMGKTLLEGDENEKLAIKIENEKPFFQCLIPIVGKETEEIKLGYAEIIKAGYSTIDLKRACALTKEELGKNESVAIQLNSRFERLKPGQDFVSTFLSKLEDSLRNIDLSGIEPKARTQILKEMAERNAALKVNYERTINATQTQIKEIEQQRNAMKSIRTILRQCL